MTNRLTIVQARMGSQRLPGKVLMPLGDKTVLEHVIHRVQKARIGKLVVATTFGKEDDPIFDLCQRLEVDCARGEKADVLARFVWAVNYYGGDHIIRVTADCPFIDEVLLRAVARKLDEGYDYVGVKGAPDGWHQEAFTAKALHLADRRATGLQDREHVVPWMIRHLDCGWVHTDIKGPSLTLDTPADLQRLREMIAA